MARPRLISDDQILEAMRNTVLAHGQKASLDQVAATLGVTAPALLKRFGSRDELMLRALSPPSNPQWLQELQKGPGEGTLRDQLLRLFSMISDFMAEVIPCMMALRESGIPHDKVFNKARPPELAMKAWAHWLAAAREKGLVKARETETAAFAIIGALQTRAFFAHLQQQGFSASSQRHYLEELVELFCRALSAPPSRPRPIRSRSR
ncbi:MAG: TetR/AcrR family transcriptional regulator [Myxococcaceae bacterium]